MENVLEFCGKEIILHTYNVRDIYTFRRGPQSKIIPFLLPFPNLVLAKYDETLVKYVCIICPLKMPIYLFNLVTKPRDYYAVSFK